MRFFTYKALLTVLVMGLGLLQFDATAQVVVTQSFDANTFPPTGWSVYPTITTSMWSRWTTGTSPTCVPHSGAGMARWSPRNQTQNRSQSLFTSRFDLSGAGTAIAHVSFWYFRDTTNSNTNDTVSVYYNTSIDSVNGVLLGTVSRYTPNLTDTGWTQVTFALPASVDDTNYISFRGFVRNTPSGTSFRTFIDDINYETYPGPCSGAPAIGAASSPDTVICGGSGTSRLNLAGTSSSTGIVYQWAKADSANGAYVPMVGVTGTAATSTSITATSWFRCIAICTNTGDTSLSNAIRVVVDTNQRPVVTVSPSSAVRCSNSTTRILLTASGASTSYSWATTQSQTVLGSSDTISVLPNQSTTYVVTGLNGTVCKDTQSVVVTVSNPPTVTGVTRSDTAVCAGDSVTLTVNTQFTGTNYSYAWSPGGYTTRTITTSVAVATTYSVTVTNNGCSGTLSTGTTTVGILPAPIVGTIASSDTLLCGGSGTVQLSLSGSTGAVYYWYSSSSASGPWTLDATSSASTYTTGTLTGPTYFQAIASCPANVTLDDTSAVQFVNVSTGPLPVVSVTPSVNIYCLNSNDTVPTFVATGGSTYTWSNANNLTISAAGDTATPNNYTNGGLQTYIVTGFDSYGCRDTATVNFRVAGTPVVSATPAAPSLCIGDSVTLNATQTGTGFGVTYTWSNGLTGNSIRIPVTASATLTVYCESIYGCNSRDTVVITAYAAPVAGTIVSADSVICGGSGVTDLSLNGSAGSSFAWYYGASATGPWTLTTAQGAAITTDTLTAPTYFICVAACPSATSADTSSALLVNVTSNPAPVVVTDSSQVFWCNNTPAAALNAYGAVTYTWTPATGLSGTTGSTVYASPTQSTYYTVTGYDATGCSATAITWLRYRVAPTVTVTPGNGNVCQGDSITLNANAQNVGNGGTMNYTWQPGGSTGNSLTVAPSATTSYTVVGVSSFGCTDTNSTDFATVTVDPLPVAGFTYFTNQNYLVLTNTSTDYISYQIDYGDGISGWTQVIDHNYQTAGQYDVRLVATNACGSDTFSVTINITSVGIDQVVALQLSVLPNPVKDQVRISYLGNAQVVEVLDLLGNKVAARKVAAADRNVVEMDLSGIASGIYFARVTDAQGASATMRFVKQ